MNAEVVAERLACVSSQMASMCLIHQTVIEASGSGAQRAYYCHRLQRRALVTQAADPWVVQEPPLSVAAGQPLAHELVRSPGCEWEPSWLLAPLVAVVLALLFALLGDSVECPRARPSVGRHSRPSSLPAAKR